MELKLPVASACGIASSATDNTEELFWSAAVTLVVRDGLTDCCWLLLLLQLSTASSDAAATEVPCTPPPPSALQARTLIMFVPGINEIIRWSLPAILLSSSCGLKKSRKKDAVPEKS
jgi:hypothetical protein